MLEAGKCLGVTFLFAWFFYRSIWAVLPLGTIGIFLWRKDAKRKAEQDRRKLILQFSDCIRCVDGALRAGYSVENAFLASLPDMKLLYGEQSFICRELERMRRGFVVNMTIEELFRDLGERSGAVPIQEFAQVLTIAKRSGGSIPEMIGLSAAIIRQKTEAEEEIRTQTAARRLEQGIMDVMPFGIVIYLEISNPGYFDLLFQGGLGPVIMSGCLAAYLGAYCLAERILEKTCAIWD